MVNLLTINQFTCFIHKKKLSIGKLLSVIPFSQSNTDEKINRPSRSVFTKVAYVFTYAVILQISTRKKKRFPIRETVEIVLQADSKKRDRKSLVATKYRKKHLSISFTFVLFLSQLSLDQKVLNFKSLKP